MYIVIKLLYYNIIAYDEMENELQKQLNIQKCNGIIINGVIGVGKHEVVE